MEVTDHIGIAKDIVQSLPKAKKTIRMYPENNPIYIKAVDDIFSKFSDFFNYKDELVLKIKQYDIFLDSEQIYHNPDKDDNLALFFFKDGLRELSFFKGLQRREMEDFLGIISLDFDKADIDDDVVTLLWGRDFQNVKYIADETIFTEDTGYESTAIAEAKEKAAGEDQLLRAYSDAFGAGEIREVQIVAITEKDLQMLIREIEKKTGDRAEKLSMILFEMLSLSENAVEREDILRFLREMVIYCLGKGNLTPLTATMKKIKAAMDNPLTDEVAKEQINLLFSVLCSKDTLKHMGEMFDSNKDIDENILNEYISLLNKDAITPFISLLGDLKTIHARKKVIDILITLGEMDIHAVARGLNDPKWYVVRNIIYILNHIKDKKAEEYLLSATRHPDVRVRKEAIKAISDLKSTPVLQALKNCLDDEDLSLRKSAVKALSNFGSETAKRLILGRVMEKEFMEREFDEKKEYFEALSRWKEADIVEFMIETLKKRSFFNRAKNNESKACAAYCLGLLGNKDALPILSEFKRSNNSLLQKYANEAITRIERGR